MNHGSAGPLLVFAAMLAAHSVDVAAAQTGEFSKLFNGRNLDGFDTVLKDRSVNSDPEGVFRVEKGTIHVSGAEYGYLITKKEYEDYHLRVEFKWGLQTYAPRKDRARDSGILFHVVGPDRVWPKSIEFQVIEGRTGEIILVGDDTAITQDGRTVTQKQGGGRIARYGQGPWKSEVGYRDPVAEVEKPHGEWNLLELIADRGNVTFKVNRKVVNRGAHAQPSKGRILLQSEGAEVYFRKIELHSFRP